MPPVFVFYYPSPPDSPRGYTGLTIREDHGISGTCTAAIVMMERLKEGFPDADCRYVDDSCADATVRGVRYVSSVAAGLSGATVLIAPTFTPDLKLEHVGEALKAVVFVTQTHEIRCGATAAHQLLELRSRGVRLGFAFLCAWVERYLRQNDTKGVIERFADPALTVHIPNPLVSDCLPSVESVVSAGRERPRDFGFYACHERGGDLAERAVRLAGLEMASKSYSDPGLESLGKRELFEAMAGTRVFPYLLSRPNGRFHKDMHPCCVTEALACGMRVVTYRQSAMVELFEGMCDWLAPPRGCQDRIGNCIEDVEIPELRAPENVAAVSSALAEVLREARTEDDAARERRVRAVREAYGAEAVGARWIAYMRRVLEACSAEA